MLHGESTRAQELMNRGYYFWIHGPGSDAANQIGSIPLSYDQYLTQSLSGVPLPGFEYAMGTDMKDICLWWSTMRVLGYTHRPEHRIYWQNLIRGFFYFIFPDKSGFYPAGDSQDPTIWTSTHYAHSYLGNAAYLAAEEGYLQWARVGRGLSSYLHTRTYGDADEVLSFLRTDNMTEINPFTSNLPRFFCPLIGQNTYCSFRRSWDTSTTWVGFAVSGSAPADHQIPDSGSFFIWAKDSFVTAPARTYLGYDHAIFTNLGIYNSGAPNHNSNPLPFDRAAPSKLNRTRINEVSGGSGEFAYLMMNGDGIYNQHYPTVYSAVAPVNTYRRHFFYTSDSDLVVVVDRANLKSAAATQFRLRNSNKNSAPTYASGSLNMPSSSGNAKLTARFLRESASDALTVSILDETVELASVQDYEVPATERGHRVSVQSPSSSIHNWISVMSVRNSSAPPGDLDSLLQISQSDGSGLGVYVNGWALLFARTETLRSSVLSYTVSAASATQSVVYHLVADIAPGCYGVSINSATTAYFQAETNDFTLFFSAPSSSLPHAVTITPASSSVCGAAPPRDNGGYIPVAASPPRAYPTPVAAGSSPKVAGAPSVVGQPTSAAGQPSIPPNPSGGNSQTSATDRVIGSYLFLLCSLAISFSL